MGRSEFTGLADAREYKSSLLLLSDSLSLNSSFNVRNGEAGLGASQAIVLHASSSNTLSLSFILLSNLRFSGRALKSLSTLKGGTAPLLGSDGDLLVVKVGILTLALYKTLVRVTQPVSASLLFLKGRLDNL